MKQFPLGFWNYAPMGQYGTEAVKDWDDAGMNLCLSPHFDCLRDDPKDLVAILDECEKRGIQLLIDDTRATWTGVGGQADGCYAQAHPEEKSVGAASDPDGYRKQFMEAVHDFGNHPATYGFFVGDEPVLDQMEDAKMAIRIQRECAPHLHPFINFNPYYDGNEKHLNGMEFDEWIDNFVHDTGIEQLSYDFYAQLNPKDEAETGINGYYKTLRRFMEAAKRNNLPLWVTNLSVAHFRYRCPKEDDFRWQLNTSVASGASCVWWFFFYMRLCRINYRIAPIDELGERTETYEWLSRVQRSFQHQYGKLFLQLTHDETYHVDKAYGGYPLLEYKRHPLLKNVTCEHQLPGLVSFFHMPDGTKYMVLVNNSQKESGYFRCTFTAAVKELYRVAFAPLYCCSQNGKKAEALEMTTIGPWGGSEVNCRENDVCNDYRHDEEGIKNGAWLAPGQMEVYRLIV